ncbi:MAG TPA: hypothetical protein VFI48_09625 [Hyphomicrobiaceae bacterium]|nr:hypothetical protein [Hyphomicrobiaceae bacterium]
MALDRRSEPVVRRLAQGQWGGATFFTASAFAPAAPSHADMQFSMASWLSDLAGRTKDLLDELQTADLVAMVATAGENVQQVASVVGEACKAKHVTTIAFVLGSASAPREALSSTLRQLRPWTLMLVIAASEETIAEALAALRA